MVFDGNIISSIDLTAIQKVDNKFSKFKIIDRS